MWKLLLPILVLHTCIASGRQSCGNGWIEGPFKSCYKFVMSPRATWKRAQGFCRDMGGYLATLETKEEVIWMRGYRAYHSRLRERSWVGGYERDGKWYWKEMIADSPMLFADWASGQPDNQGGRQDCLNLFANGADRHPTNDWYHFDDDYCDNTLPYICEKRLYDDM